MAIDQRVLDSIALSRDEYDLIASRLGREPSEVELGMFGVDLPPPVRIRYNIAVVIGLTMR